MEVSIFPVNFNFLLQDLEASIWKIKSQLQKSGGKWRFWALHGMVHIWLKNRDNNSELVSFSILKGCQHVSHLNFLSNSTPCRPKFSSNMVKFENWKNENISLQMIEQQQLNKNNKTLGKWWRRAHARWPPYEPKKCPWNWLN